MRYFTNELWEQLNSQIPEVKEEAKRQWVTNSNEYFQRFELLKDRLSSKIFKALKTDFLHDTCLQKLEVTHGTMGIKNPIEVALIVSDGINVWRISYKKVNKILIDYEKQDSSFLERRGFDTLGYDELTEVDQNTLSHEILFASGTTIVVHFVNKNIFFTKLS